MVVAAPARLSADQRSRQKDSSAPLHKLSGNCSVSEERGAINFVSCSFQMKLHLLADLFILVPLNDGEKEFTKKSMLKTQEANNAPPDFKGNLLMAWKFIYKLIRQSDINTKPLVFTDPAGNAYLSCRWYTEAPLLRECRLDQFRPRQ